MALLQRLTIANLGNPISIGEVDLVGGTATDVGTVQGHSALAAIALNRCTCGPPLGHLDARIVGDDITISSSAVAESSTITYMVVG